MKIEVIEINNCFNCSHCSFIKNKNQWKCKKNNKYLNAGNIFTIDDSCPLEDKITLEITGNFICLKK